MTTGWFPGESGNPAHAAFLAALGTCAQERGLLDASPDHTTLHVWGDVLVVLVAVPGLADLPARPTLEVVSRFGPVPDLMSGWETDGYLADAYEAMDLSGVGTTPAGLAHHAFGWFEAQLRRPVERHEWTSRDRVTRTGWWCRDPDEQLAAARLGWWFRRRAPQPDRVVRLR